VIDVSVPNGVGERPFATEFEEEWYQDGLIERRPRTVVVWARSPQEAGEKSGLVFETFREATDAELDVWLEKTDDPLTARELRALLGMVMRAQRAVGRKRLKARERGRIDSDQKLARRYAALQRKLELMTQEEAA
jgi:hypothetical protein